MQTKINQQENSPEFLVDEFYEQLNSQSLVSALTGSIYLHPIRIEGSSDLQERGFVENTIISTGKNPFTQQEMTLDDLATIKNDEHVERIISDAKAKFLNENKTHLQFDKIKALLEDKTYQHEQIEMSEEESDDYILSDDELVEAILSN